MKIIIIDDDAFFQKYYDTNLKNIGYDVETASNGHEGLEKITANKPDLILLDLIMPEEDGFEVLKTLKTDANLKQIPVLVFSTLGQEHEVEEAKNLGAAGYINKGLSDFEATKSTIATILKK